MNAELADVKYADQLVQMSDGELKQETKEKIYSSAFWNRQNHESHSQVDACMNEWLRREGNNSTYKKLHEEVVNEYSRKFV